MQFSDTVNKNGLYEKFQDLTKTNSNSYSVAKYTNDANNAYAQFMWLAIRASQKHPADDVNQTDYPIITINLVSGQQDYALTTDNSTIPNQIWDILRIERQTSNGVWDILTPYDQVNSPSSLTQATSTQGTPTRYSLLANSIWLDPVPNYALSNGLKVYFQRTPVYFVSTDTTKKPGIPDLFHLYLSLLPAYNYCVINIPSLATGYFNSIQRMEQDISNYYFFRNKGQRKNMQTRIDSPR